MKKIRLFFVTAIMLAVMFTLVGCNDGIKDGKYKLHPITYDDITYECFKGSYLDIDGKNATLTLVYDGNTKSTKGVIEGSGSDLTLKLNDGSVFTISYHADDDEIWLKSNEGTMMAFKL